MPLDDVKAIGKALGCSINDVLLACVAGAIGDYLREPGRRPPTARRSARWCRSTCAPLDEAWKLGNQFGLVPLVLPIGIDNPLARVLRGAPAHGRAEGRLPAAARVRACWRGRPGAASRCRTRVLEPFAQKATAVMTNVPGPQQPLYFAGATCTQTMFWVPQSGDIGVGVSILSYDGGVQFGLITDEALCADPQEIIDRFEPEFERLVYAMLLAPWDEQLDPAVAKHALMATETAAGIAAHMQHPPGTAASAGNGAQAPEAAAKAPTLRKRKSAFAAARSHH